LSQDPIQGGAQPPTFRYTYPQPCHCSHGFHPWSKFNEHGWSNFNARRHVKDAWRNDVMHPRASYSEHQAKDVMENSRALMIKIAEIV
ncbi:MAG: hypothetical protein ACREXX_23735, partial [Gammaproteobacteria bacterium]